MGSRNKKLYLVIVSAVFMLTIFLLSTNFALAINQNDLGLNQVEETIILPTLDIRVIIARIIQVILGLLGIISVGIIVYGGVVWMTSEGDQEKINKAKKIIINWIIGLIIIFLAYIIVIFIFRALGVDMGISFRQTSGYASFGRGALGGGIIESHYPQRDAIGVPRNTKIIVTFKEEMDLGSFIKGYVYPGDDEPDDLTTFWDDFERMDEYDEAGERNYVWLNNGLNQADPNFFRWREFLLNDENIKIFRTEDDPIEVLGFDEVYVKYTITLDRETTIVFRPVEFLGSQLREIYYSVRLGEEIKKYNGDDAFPAGPAGFYIWQFEVSIFIDATPPRVEDVFPVHNFQPPGGRADSDREYRNAVIQINFNEAIDPTTISHIIVYDITGGGPVECDGLGQDSCENKEGCTVKEYACSGSDGCSELELEDCVAAEGCIVEEYACLGGNSLSGSIELVNQYRTAEFITDFTCGLNSCGEEIYCLPGMADIRVVIQAATLSNTISSEIPSYSDGLDGIIDVASNSLNGNGENGLDSLTDGLNCLGQEEGGHYSCAIGPNPQANLQGEDDFEGNHKLYWDNFVWEFSTNDTINLDPPLVEDIYPGSSLAERQEVDLAEPAKILFNGRMMGRTLKTDNIKLLTDNIITIDNTQFEEKDFFWWSINFRNEDIGGECQNSPPDRNLTCVDITNGDVCNFFADICEWNEDDAECSLIGDNQNPECSNILEVTACQDYTSFYCDWQGDEKKTRVYVPHEPYQTTPENQNPRYDYSGHLNAKIKNIYQNCYKPASFSDECAGDPSCCISAIAPYYHPNTNDCPEPLPMDWVPCVNISDEDSCDERIDCGWSGDDAGECLSE